MKIAVTGATGQLGRIVVEKLKERITADNIVALVRTPQKATGLGVEVREFDYNRPERLADALAGIDKLLLISGNEIGKRFEQHSHVVDAAGKAGVKLIAYTSLLRANASSLVLAEEHYLTEMAIEKSGIPFVILRHGWYTENYTDSLPGIIAGGALYGSSADGKTSPAAREDFAEAAAVVLTTEGHEGKTYELAGDEAFTMSDFAAEISRQTGKNIPYINLPVEEYASFLAKTGMPEGIAQFYASTHVSTEKGDLFDDTHQLSKLTGRPTRPISKVISGFMAHNN